MSEVESQLAIIKQGIRQYAPLVAEFFAVDTPLGEYVKNLYAYKISPIHRQRQNLFKRKVKQLMERDYSPEEIQTARINWDKDWVVNIIDHHGVLNHPMLIATNIVANLWQLPTEQPEGIVVLSDSGVSLNNFFHKRGVKFKGEQINIIPTRERLAVAYAAAKREKIDLVKNNKNFNKSELKFLQDYSKYWQVDARDYKQQIQKVNYALWPRLFAATIQNKIPKMVYVANEDIAQEMLKLYWQDKANLFYQVIFNKELRDKVLKEFAGIAGCWFSQPNKGTHFFWGLDSEQRKVSLTIHGNKLTATDFTIALTPEALLDALAKKRIYPSMFLVYGISSFYCNVRPLVGYGSMTYQTRMKEAWFRVLTGEEKELVAQVDTKGFIGPLKVTYGWNAKQGYYDLSALDVMYRGGLTKEYLDKLRALPLNGLLLPALIDMYASYVPQAEKQPITITSNDLMGKSFEWIKSAGVA